MIFNQSLKKPLKSSDPIHQVGALFYTPFLQKCRREFVVIRNLLSGKTRRHDFPRAVEVRTLGRRKLGQHMILSLHPFTVVVAARIPNLGSVPAGHRNRPGHNLRDTQAPLLLAEVEISKSRMLASFTHQQPEFKPALQVDLRLPAYNEGVFAPR